MLGLAALLLAGRFGQFASPDDVLAALSDVNQALSQAFVVEQLLAAKTRDKIKRRQHVMKVIQPIQARVLQSYGFSDAEEARTAFSAHSSSDPRIAEATAELQSVIAKHISIVPTEEHQAEDIISEESRRRLAVTDENKTAMLSEIVQKGAKWADAELRRISTTMQNEDRTQLISVRNSLNLLASRESMLEVLVRAASGEASNTKYPTGYPTQAPSASPTIAPTAAPTAAPTVAPTAAPTPSPTPACAKTLVDITNMKTSGDLPDGNQGTGLGQKDIVGGVDHAFCMFDATDGEAMYAQNTQHVSTSVFSITTGSTGDTNLEVPSTEVLPNSGGVTGLKRQPKDTSVHAAAFRERVSSSDNRYKESEQPLIQTGFAAQDLGGFCKWEQKVTAMTSVPDGTTKVYMRLLAREGGEQDSTEAGYQGYGAEYYKNILEDADRFRGFLRFCTNQTVTHLIVTAAEAGTKPGCTQWEEMVHHKNDFDNYEWLTYYNIDGNRNHTRDVGSTVKQHPVPRDKRFVQTRVLIRNSDPMEKGWVKQVQILDGTDCGEL